MHLWHRFAASKIMIRWRLNPPQLIRSERWIERGVVFDGEVVASSLVDDIDNFLKRHGGNYVPWFEWNRNHGQLVTQGPCVNFTLRSMFCAADDCVVVSGWQRADNRKSHSASLPSGSPRWSEQLTSYQRMPANAASRSPPGSPRRKPRLTGCCVPISQPIAIPSGQARRKSDLRSGECGSFSIAIPSGRARRKSDLRGGECGSFSIVIPSGRARRKSDLRGGECVASLSLSNRDKPEGNPL